MTVEEVAGLRQQLLACRAQAMATVGTLEAALATLPTPAPPEPEKPKPKHFGEEVA